MALDPHSEARARSASSEPSSPQIKVCVEVVEVILSKQRQKLTAPEEGIFLFMVEVVYSSFVSRERE